MWTSEKCLASVEVASVPALLTCVLAPLTSSCFVFVWSALPIILAIADAEVLSWPHQSQAIKMKHLLISVVITSHILNVFIDKLTTNPYKL